MALKILIISNNCLSRHNSNGRTLLNLLGGFQKEELCQFYVANEVPREASCANFLRITDRDVIGSYLSPKKRLSRWEEAVLEEDAPPAASGSGYGRKTAPKALFRDLIWNTSRWVRRALIRFARYNGVDLVLLQAGDNVFLHRLARRVAGACRIPLVIYNTEDYYFKDYDYMKRTAGAGLLYKLYHRTFCREFKRLISASAREVYNCDGLRTLYNEAFRRSGVTVYPSTDLRAVEAVTEDGYISYAGNLGCGRHRVLIEVGRGLRALSPDLSLDVYGPADLEVAEALSAAPGVRYHGFVSYGEVCRVMEGSRLLVHVESFDDYYRRDTRFAFSTKLTDYAASGVPIFLCAPATCEAAAYLGEHGAAFIATEEGEIQAVLRGALYNAEERDAVRGRALALSGEHNSLPKNGEHFKEILEGAIHDSKKTAKD